MANVIRGRPLNVSSNQFEYKTVMSISFLFYSSTPRIISGYKKKGFVRTEVPYQTCLPASTQTIHYIILNKDVEGNAGSFPKQGLVIKPSFVAIK